MNRELPMEIRRNKIRGSLAGGAIGDALGYPVEFMRLHEILRAYGNAGITAYRLDPKTGKALISDDTQMTLFTANGILYTETRGCLRGIGGELSGYVAGFYADWLTTQTSPFTREQKDRYAGGNGFSWLLNVPELYSRRAPGNSCLSALMDLSKREGYYNYLERPVNDSKGCGGIMRVAPLGLRYNLPNLWQLDRDGAALAAVTHGHPLGYMTAAVLTHILNRILYGNPELTLKEIICEARDVVCEGFRDRAHVDELRACIDEAIALSENRDPDISNIKKLGQGWVAEETLSISIYCALRHEDDFSAGVIAAVNHDGDSDSTGAVTGNILGAIHGYDQIGDQWKENLELLDVILEMADDLTDGCKMTEYGSYRDEDWLQKYVLGHRVEKKGLHPDSLS